MHFDAAYRILAEGKMLECRQKVAVLSSHHATSSALESIGEVRICNKLDSCINYYVIYHVIYHSIRHFLCYVVYYAFDAVCVCCCIVVLIMERSVHCSPELQHYNLYVSRRMRCVLMMPMRTLLAFILCDQCLRAAQTTPPLALSPAPWTSSPPVSPPVHLML